VGLILKLQAASGSPARRCTAPQLEYGKDGVQLHSQVVELLES
jgi:hypothetical protein